MSSSTWPKAFDVNLATDGKLIATGRYPLKAAAARLLEEGLAHGATRLRLRFSDARRSEQTATVSEALK